MYVCKYFKDSFGSLNKFRNCYLQIIIAKKYTKTTKIFLRIWELNKFLVTPTTENHVTDAYLHSKSKDFFRKLGYQELLCNFNTGYTYNLSKITAIFVDSTLTLQVSVTLQNTNYVDLNPFIYNVSDEIL